ncbi:carbohydrate ABC transporter permease [Frankia sp. CNm7]|uniref:Carbohydrate ABC transporter permease n=1 Tax=Frankia nepalensis TaxID=1836974 RepID=A0A937RNZ3_9ACTN|nr:carbohydrate ABC transporter permease [Frankia nepalensis]MBL7500779.1 carbohydrate ABC transporter permease [Frankia nepalensis]MBL7515549.1 carbohydrate ABC transporter permease [Frankia nepalensis]MBL7519089.1 carbohydrate ABC transporter permease [Frankia nepalensis]MBL7633532.1 carbohydrate ABC transporter permease [Frankia nepalensis]
MPGHDRRPRATAAAVTRHAVLILTVFGMLFPMLWALSASFKPGSDVYGASPLPMPATLENYRYALGEFPVARLLLNTFVTAAGVTVLHLAAGLLAAWSFVRFAHRGQRVVLGLVTVALVVPPQALIIPHFLMVARLGQRDTFVGLIVPQLATCALAVLLLREHIRAIPPTLIGAATLDGATHAETLRRVVLPLLRGALGAVAIVVFITTWNEYLWPVLVAPSPEHTTIQVGLQMFETQEGPEHGPLLAAAMLATMPVVAVYFLASRRIADAFLQSGLR